MFVRLVMIVHCVQMIARFLRRSHQICLCVFVQREREMSGASSSVISGCQLPARNYIQQTQLYHAANFCSIIVPLHLLVANIIIQEILINS